MWHTATMATDSPSETATEELDRLTAAFTQATTRLNTTRDALHEGIVRHLMARSAPPGKIADHTPYDRNHTGRLGKAAGVPSLRGPDAGPAPVYDAETERAALAELDKLTTAFKRAEVKVDDARVPLQEAIVRHYAARTLKPGVIADHVPYDRNHVLRIARGAGAPRIRDAAGQS